MEVIKQETEDKIDSLEEQIDKYQEIVDLQKESLRTTKEQNDYDKNASDKLKNISKIQSKINQLSLDDSREAQSEKKRLEEELSKAQTELSDYQNDYAYDKTVENLDKMAEEQEKAKKEEIEMERDKISSYQKLYDLAIARIESEGGDLLDTLLDWNTEYGNDLNDTIVKAWDDAAAALGRYQYKYKETIGATNGNISTSEKGNNNVLVDNTKEINSIVSKMKSNSKAWATSNNKEYLESENQRLGSSLKSLGVSTVYNDGDGVWYIDNVGGKRLYDVYPKYHTGGIVGRSALKSNETMAILEDGELVVDKNKSNNLLKLMEVSGKFFKKYKDTFVVPPSSDLYRFMNANSALEYVGTTKTVNQPMAFNPNIEINISHNGSMSDSDAKRYGNIAADTALQKLNEAFMRKGISNIGNATLK